MRISRFVSPFCYPPPPSFETYFLLTDTAIKKKRTHDCYYKRAIILKNVNIFCTHTLFCYSDKMFSNFETSVVI